MSCLGNIAWFILAGFWQWLGWGIVGILWCCTIVGIPVGVQCFKMASLSLFPFGKRVVYRGGAGSLLLNILWICFGGLGLTIALVANGLLLCATIIGIPFGLQCFKQARLALMPFGAEVI